MGIVSLGPLRCRVNSHIDAIETTIETIRLVVSDAAPERCWMRGFQTDGARYLMNNKFNLDLMVFLAFARKTRSSLRASSA
jgi:hypothetical protein